MGDFAKAVKVFRQGDLPEGTLRPDEPPHADGDPIGVPDLFIVMEGNFRGWLVYRCLDGGMVCLADLKEHRELLSERPPVP